MADDKDPECRPLKPVLEPSVIKAFVAGIIVGSLNKNVLLGFLIGALGGVYVQQNVLGIPDVVDTWRKLVEKWKSTSGKK